MSSRCSATPAVLLVIGTLFIPGMTFAQATGACCLDLETASFCLDNILAAECAANDVYLGDGTVCLDVATVFDTVEECVDGNTGVLPVELTRFQVVSGTDGTGAVLSWATSSETNNAGFSVEQEVRLDHFVELGFVEGHGTTDEPREYSFAIVDLDPGLHRFRLKQIDFDGAFEYSPVIEAAVTVPDRFLIEPAYPNPFNPSTRLRFAVAAEQQVEVTLVNSAGQSVRTLHNGTVTAGEMKTLTIMAETLPSGTYLVHFEGSKGLSATERIVLSK